ncbi:glycosyltransferase [Paraburkholderia phymatum]|uniref:glycosyltransferase n=1 Tax=Paraburkholderia phymatum TaxID=148447 RepID=UPI0031705F36
METVIARVLAEITRQGHKGKLFLLGGSMHEGWLQGLDHCVIGTPRERRWKRYLKYALQSAIVLRRFKPDVLLCADGAALKIARPIRSLFLSEAPIGAWFHEALERAHVSELRAADFHLCINTANERLIANAAELQGQCTYLVHNPVDVTENSREIVRPHAESRFLYVGRLTYEYPKNIKDLVIALARVGGAWKATIVGDGPDRERLMNCAIQYGVADRIEWQGWKADPWENIQSASALVLTSSFEGFPMVLSEAMARGLPCVSSDCAGARDIVKTGVNGWLYRAGRVEELALILEGVVKGDRQLPEGSAVRASVLKFDSSNVVKGIIDACAAECTRRKDLRGLTQ